MSKSRESKLKKLSKDNIEKPSFFDEPIESATFNEVELKTEEPSILSSEAESSSINRPAPISGNSYATTGLVARRSVSSYILAQDDERFDTPTGVAIRHVEGKIVAEVEMRNGSGLPDHSEIRRVASKLGGVDEDVLDICIANATRNGASADGLFHIDVDAIVAARERGKKQKREGGVTYSSGSQEWARQSVVDALQCLDSLYVSLDASARNRRGKMIREYDRVFTIKRKVIEEGNDRLIAIVYYFGDWFDQWQEGAVLAPQSLLALDARNGAPAKALGRYFTLLACERNKDGEIVRPVREVLQTVRRSLHYGKNPQRLRSWLEDNLAELVTEKVLDSWRYYPEQAFSALPPYKWIDAWLDLYVAVRPIFDRSQPVLETAG